MMTRLTTATRLIVATLTLIALTATANAQNDESAANAPTVVAPAPQVELNRLVTAHEIVDREPVAANSAHYADEERVYIFVDVHNPTGPEGELTLEWRHESGRVFAQTLEYGQSRRWRTWAARRMSERYVGSWEVEVFDSTGRSLGELGFEVLPVEEDDVAPPMAESVAAELGC